MNAACVGKRPLSLACCVALMAHAWGCGGGGEGASDRPATYPVTGVVTYNGQPLAGAAVTFTPNLPVSQMGKGKGAFGVTDEEGKYTLTSFTSGDGAVPGEYGVTITKMEGPPPLPPDFNEEEDYEPPDENAPPPKPAKSLIPEKYGKIGTSGFKVTITEGENTEDFALTD